MQPGATTDIGYRKQVARALLSAGPDQLGLAVPELAVASDAAGAPEAAAAAGGLSFGWPAGLAPIPQPPAAVPDPDGPLSTADVLVVTWTAAEHKALADVLTPGHPPNRWLPYRHRFSDRFLAQIRAGAPARAAGRLGSWYRIRVGGRQVVCVKSELHLNQDGIATGPGRATLPVRELFAQLIEEVQPQLVLTVGTAGGVYGHHGLGDVVVTRAAKFRLADEFANEPFNHQTYRSDWTLPTSQLATAEQLMADVRSRLVEPGFGPPTKRYPFPDSLVSSEPNLAAIRRDGVDFPAFHPILTTDFFEFGTSANHLEQEGCGVEMGDAALGLACQSMAAPPKWAVVRNLSDPQINAALPTGKGQLNMQIHWAVWYYAVFGYWTSVAGALATWGLIAGLDGS
jgi:nucleoside phosphorylase